MNRQQSTILVKQGYISLQQNNVAQAAEFFNQAIKKDPSFFDAWFALGNLLAQTNNLDQAVYALQKATQTDPSNSLAHGQLGVALYRLQRLDEAISCYKKVIHLQVDNPAAYANLAMVYLDTGNRDEAVNYCLKAIEIKPDFTGAHILLGSSYSSLGLFEKSLSSYNDAIRLEEDNLSALAGKANALIKLGDKKGAYETIKHNLDINNVDPSVAIAYAAASTVINKEVDALAYLEKTLEIPVLTHMQKLQLHFSAGSLLDHIGRYDKAFQHYVNGNALAQRNYDAESDRVMFDDIIKAFSGEKFARFPRVDEQTDKVPVFIIGMPRSGTSLIERILGAHEAVYPAGELSEIPKLAESISGGGEKFPANMAMLDTGSVHRLSQEYLQYTANISDDMKVVTDKLPHNFLFLGFITLLFPGAKIIHCKRDPLDTCLSNYFQYFSGSLEYPYDLEDIAIHYNQYRRIMRHWRDELKIPMLEIVYEDMVKDQVKETEKLLSFLDLPWDENCIRFNESRQMTRTASYEQVRQPIYSQSIARWKHYETHLKGLIDHLNL